MVLSNKTCRDLRKWSMEETPKHDQLLYLFAFTLLQGFPMSRTSISLLLSLISSLAHTAPGPTSNPKRTAAAVMPLTGKGIDSTSSEIITDALTDELMNSPFVRVMERTQMESILKEQGFQSSGSCDGSECAVQIGKLLATQWIVLGSVGKLGNAYTLSVRVVDVGSGEIVGSARRQQLGAIEDITTQMIPAIVQDIANSFKSGTDSSGRNQPRGPASAPVQAPIAPSQTPAPKPVAAPTARPKSPPADQPQRKWTLFGEVGGGVARSKSSFDLAPDSDMSGVSDNTGRFLSASAGIGLFLVPSLRLDLGAGISRTSTSCEWSLADSTLYSGDGSLDMTYRNLDLLARTRWIANPWLGLNLGALYALKLGGEGEVSLSINDPFDGLIESSHSFDLGEDNFPSQRSALRFLVGADIRVTSHLWAIATAFYSPNPDLKGDDFSQSANLLLIGLRAEY